MASSPRAAVLEDIAHGHAPLHHVEDAADRSAPAIEPGVSLKTWDKEGLLASIEQGAPLKHVDPSQVHDASTPVIEPDVHLHTNSHKELLTEVKAAAGHAAVVRELSAVSDAAGAGDGAEDAAVNPLVAQLHHVETADHSKPVIEASTHVEQWDKAGYLNSIALGAPLKHVDPSQVHDASTPAIDPDARVGENPAKAVLQQISAGEVPELKHVQPPPQ